MPFSKTAVVAAAGTLVSLAALLLGGAQGAGWINVVTIGIAAA